MIKLLTRHQIVKYNDILVDAFDAEEYIFLRIRPVYGKHKAFSCGQFGSRQFARLTNPKKDLHTFLMKCPSALRSQEFYETFYDELTINQRWGCENARRNYG